MDKLKMEDKKRIKDITIEGAHIIWRNFEGRQTQYNDKGKRNFNLVIPPEMVDDLRAEGWNIKERPPRKEGDDILYHMHVKVQFDSPYPPAIWMITSRGKTQLTEKNAKLLDTARIKSIDLTVRPYVYPETPLRPSGVSAYLKKMFVIIQEDFLDEKYANVPDTSYTNDSDEGLPFKED